MFSNRFFTSLSDYTQSRIPAENSMRFTQKLLSLYSTVTNEDIQRQLVLLENELKSDIAFTQEDLNTHLVGWAGRGYLSICKLLIEKGAAADCEVSCEGGKVTPLMSAAKSDQVEVVRFLLEYPMCKKTLDESLLRAVQLNQRGAIETVKILVAAGADINIIDKGINGNSENSCLDYAIDNYAQSKWEGHKQVAMFLVRLGATQVSPRRTGYELTEWVSDKQTSRYIDFSSALSDIRYAVKAQIPQLNTATAGILLALRGEQTSYFSTLPREMIEFFIAPMVAASLPPSLAAKFEASIQKRTHAEADDVYESDGPRKRTFG